MNPETTRWKIARPCTADWERMAGDDRKRFCEQCGKHVHNVSAMTRAERAEFAKPANQEECITYVHRADGTPIDLSAWAKMRRGIPLLRLVRWTALAALLPTILTGCMRGVRVPTTGVRRFTQPPPVTEALEGSTSPSTNPAPEGEKYETRTLDK